MNMPKDKQAQGRTYFRMNTASLHKMCVSLRQWNAIAAIDIFNEKEFSYDRCPYSVYLNIPLLTRVITERDHTSHQRIVIEQVLVTEWRMV